MTSRLSGSGLSDRPSSTVRAKVVCCKRLDHSIFRPSTAQPPGSRPHASRVATHGQQVASFGGFYPSAEVQSAYSTAPADRAVHSWNVKQFYLSHRENSTPSQSGPGSDSHKGGTPYSSKFQHYWSLTIKLFSVTSGHSFEECYPTAEMQLDHVLLMHVLN